MHPSEERFARLARLARRVPDDAPPDNLPPALATRTLAQLRAGRNPAASPWEQLSPGAVTLAAITAAVCVFFSSRTLHTPPPDESALARLMVENQLEP